MKATASHLSSVSAKMFRHNQTTHLLTPTCTFPCRSVIQEAFYSPTFIHPSALSVPTISLHRCRHCVFTGAPSPSPSTPAGHPPPPSAPRCLTFGTAVLTPSRCQSMRRDAGIVLFFSEKNSPKRSVWHTSFYLRFSLHRADRMLPKWDQKMYIFQLGWWAETASRWNASGWWGHSISDLMHPRMACYFWLAALEFHTGWWWQGGSKQLCRPVDSAMSD